MAKPAPMDGTDMVQHPVAPGETFTYRFVLPDAGTFWYHSHSNERVQMERGLYGALVVTPGFLVGSGRSRELARVLVGVATANLVLSLALTPAVGLEGPALGTAIPFALAFPLLLRTGLGASGATLGELPVPKAINAITGGELDAAAAAKRAADDVKNIQKTLK